MSFEKEHKDEIDILFKMLQAHVKEKFDVDVNSIDEVKIKTRKRPLVYFRKMLMVILGEAFMKDYNQDDIAEVVELDRTSFIYHNRMHLNDYTMVKSYKEEYDQLKNSYLEKIGI